MKYATFPNVRKWTPNGIVDDPSKIVTFCKKESAVCADADP